MNKDEAQARADRIRAFQSELAVLRREGVLSLSDAAQDAVQQYHSGLLRRYAAEFDVDTSLDQKQLSWGMRLASLFGAQQLWTGVFCVVFQLLAAELLLRRLGILKYVAMIPVTLGLLCVATWVVPGVNCTSVL